MIRYALVLHNSLGGFLTTEQLAFSLDLQSLDDLPSRTTATLEGATNALEHIHFPADGRTSSLGSLGAHRNPGLAPWHRRNSQDTLWSISSSIREVLRGRTPVVTPNAKMEYGGHKGKKYAKGTFHPGLRREICLSNHVPFDTWLF